MGGSAEEVVVVAQQNPDLSHQSQTNALHEFVLPCGSELTPAARFTKR